MNLFMLGAILTSDRVEVSARRRVKDQRKQLDFWDF
jgi:hypothetical protein